MNRSGVSHLGATYGPILGISAWATLIRDEIRRVAAFSANALITGPSGTGKELIARAIHAHSPRADRPFIPVDCAAVTGTLFVSHIFGHVQGAFTGASHAELGCFRAADGGTIFLDEIGELDFDLQAKLLRVLQQRTVIPVGSHEETSVDVRVIAATNRGLRQEVLAGGFRGDLYYRLNVVGLQTSPLKDHPEDIEILATEFLAKLAVHHGLPLKRLSDAALRGMHQYDWPGNVRELENVLERAALFTDGDVIGPEAAALPAADERSPETVRPAIALPVSQRPPWTPVAAARWPTMSEMERDHIRRTLEHTDYNQSAAARLLQIDRHQLMRKIHKHGIDTSRSRRGHPFQRSVECEESG